MRAGEALPPRPGSTSDVGPGRTDETSSLPIWAVSDLHLSSDGRTRMDGFGPVWRHHPAPLFAAWDALVPADALVLMPGDLSWAMKIGAITADYAQIDARSGATKLLSNGNHDYFAFTTQSRARTVCARFPTLLAVKSSAERILVPGTEVGVVVAACRGATDPADPYFPTEELLAKQARKAFQKEVGRLHAALAAAEALRQPGDALIVQIHYPPWAGLRTPTAFSAAIERARADVCVFGHLHQAHEHEGVLQGDRNGVRYHLVSCDALGMAPLHVGSMTASGFRLIKK